MSNCVAEKKKGRHLGRNSGSKKKMKRYPIGKGSDSMSRTNWDATRGTRNDV